MTQLLEIHPDNPQLRLIRQAVEHLRNGEIIVYPTDSSYALGCLIGNKEAMEKIRQVRQLDAKHNFTLVCRDLSEIASYAKINNSAYRLLKSLTPGAYTFIFNATHEVPRRLQNPKRKTIGIRVPDNTIAHSLLTELGEPIMSSTLLLPDDDLPLNDIDLIYEKLKHIVALILDGGHCGNEPTTVIDMSDDRNPILARQGKGKVEFLKE